MALLVPDYSSSSEEENEAPPAAPAPPVRAANMSASTTAAPPSSAPPPPDVSAAVVLEQLPPSSRAPKRRRPTAVAAAKKKKPKTMLFLHPSIQRLLESGSTALGGDSDSDGDDDSLLAKQRRARAAKRLQASTAPREAGDGSTLTFLPPPKHVSVEPEKQAAVTADNASAAVDTTEVESSRHETAPHTEGNYTAEQYEQYYAYYGQHYGQQQQQQQDQQAYPTTFQGEDETFGSSKRARNRERDFERALQQGDFASVAAEIVEVRGPAPNAWAPPPESVHGADRQESGEVKVQASFWNPQAGARVATVKPNRMQRHKHQLNQLAFDAKLREHELLDRKGASLKTKAETHAKYGW
ncbi:hypothetical protein PybrP1_005621 [[Pythium] brassicae (nom. inval.)]|nr:hypothetical protein PybrP1_005621 [[Pythium] brassicae (nom. inval.)]